MAPTGGPHLSAAERERRWEGRERGGRRRGGPRGPKVVVGRRVGLGG
jgi:hypothetical protein